MSMQQATRTGLIVRAHRDDDIEAMFALRYLAVHQIAGGVYDKDILEGWSGKLDTAALNEFRANPHGETRIVIEFEHKLAGYGCFHIEEEKRIADIFGLYIMPGHERRGLGSHLLIALEDKARNLSLHRCWVTSPLNAIPFFEQNGYEFVTDTMHALYTGQKVPCARLTKDIQP
ncbi:MAG: GNAT family N-acetyltransferase [Alphaproteobacteria bacterium]|nr:GNAT family N-acetyltransferase [Alphaproteobacteria bacterium]